VTTGFVNQRVVTPARRRHELLRGVYETLLSADMKEAAGWLGPTSHRSCVNLRGHFYADWLDVHIGWSEANLALRRRSVCFHSIVLQKSQNAVRLISRQRRNKQPSPIDVTLSRLSKSPVSSSLDDVVPHIIFRSPLLRLADFVLNDAKDFCNTITQQRTLRAQISVMECGRTERGKAEPLPSHPVR
jgi:hypothetical protein